MEHKQRYDPQGRDSKHVEKPKKSGIDVFARVALLYGKCVMVDLFRGQR